VSIDPSSSLRVPVQARSQRTRREIVSAARREFEHRGYAETTARTIADAAGVGTGTFYHYFPDKDAVLREIALERTTYWRDELAALGLTEPGEQFDDALVSEARRVLALLVERAVSYHRKDRGLHAVIAERRLSDPALDGVLADSERHTVATISAALASIGHDGDAETAAVMLFSLLEGAVHGHVLGTAFVSDERFSEGLVEALFRVAVPPNRFTVTPSQRKSARKLP
jgi:AcrR family transcriptional regulator